VDQADLFRFLLEVVERLGLPYAIGGSHASMTFGAYRLTNDIDVVIGLTPKTLDAFCAEFPESHFYVSDQGARDAVKRGGMFNIIEPDTGHKIDVIVPSTAFEWGQLKRAVEAPAFIGRPARFVSPEDLIVKKMEYYEEGRSEKHLNDIAQVMQTLGVKVNRTYIEECALDYDLMHVWNAVLARLGE
jgi:hypothetical protein